MIILTPRLIHNLFGGSPLPSRVDPVLVRWILLLHGCSSLSYRCHSCQEKRHSCCNFHPGESHIHRWCPDLPVGLHCASLFVSACFLALYNMSFLMIGPNLVYILFNLFSAMPILLPCVLQRIFCNVVLMSCSLAGLATCVGCSYWPKKLVNK